LQEHLVVHLKNNQTSQTSFRYLVEYCNGNHSVGSG
jgi:hypothetical protein